MIFIILLVFNLSTLLSYINNVITTVKRQHTYFNRESELVHDRPHARSEEHSRKPIIPLHYSRHVLSAACLHAND